MRKEHPHSYYIQFPRKGELTRGILTPLDLPFPMERAYMIYGVPAGAVRGGHAHRTQAQVFLCLRGSFTIEVEPPDTRLTFQLAGTQPHVGVYIGPMVWHTFRHFSAETLILGIGSEKYNEGEYIRDYKEFRATAQ